MKVGLISFHSFVNPGGVKKHILGLHQEFKRRGIQSKIIAPRRTKSENYGKDVILLGSSFPLNFGGSQADFCINFNPLAIRRFLKKEKFDVLHFHNFGFPSIVQILESSQSLNVLTFHANLEGKHFLKTFFSSFLYFLNKIVQWKIDGIIGVASLNLKYFNKYRGQKVIIPNGIDIKEFNPRVPKLEKFSDDKLNILFVGRIEERKGLIYLLRAFKILNKNYPNLRLIVVGEGPLKKGLQDWVRKNKLENVIFEKKIEEEKISSYYKSADIFVSPAIFGESFGIVLLEGMACGLPVVAFANRGYKEFLGKGKGKRFLVKPRDYRALAQKIEVLIKNPQLRREMGEWGIEEAKKYSWSRIADQVLDFYQLCLKNKKRRKKEKFTIDKFFNKLYNVFKTE